MGQQMSPYSANIALKTRRRRMGHLHQSRNSATDAVKLEAIRPCKPAFGKAKQRENNKGAHGREARRQKMRRRTRETNARRTLVVRSVP